MDRSRKQLLELTRSALWDKEPDTSLFEEGVDWEKVLRLAKEQTLQGVVSVAIERLPFSLRPSRTEALHLHQIVSLNRTYRAHQVEVLAKLLELVARAGVERPVLLKGLGVGLNYPDPTLRMCGDIDLYVGSENYYRVWDFICAEFGIEREESLADHHFDFDFMNTHIEIHRYATAPSSVVFHSREFMEWSVEQLEGDQLREISIDGVKVYLPPYNFDFIFIFYHSWRHFLTGGVGLRQLCDWGCYLSAFAEKIDRVELKWLIKLFKLHTPISLFATVCVRELGISADKFGDLASTTERRYIRVLDKIWSGGNFGFYRKIRERKSRTVIQRKWRSLRAQLYDMLFMVSIDWVYALKFYIPFFASNIGAALRGYKKLGDKL
ncbi:MAG: nucleotidyltransferase family protein [Rikenellaceae bacterium]